MSLQDVADIAAISKPHVWQIEKGSSTNPSVATLLGLACALEISPIILFSICLEDQPGVYPAPEIATVLEGADG